MANYDMGKIYSLGYSEQIDKDPAINILFVSEFNPGNMLF